MTKRLEELSVSGNGMPVMERPEAAKANLTHYWTGRKCQDGHSSRRNTKSGQCDACNYLKRTDPARLQKPSKKTQPVRSRPEYAFGPLKQQQMLEVYAKTGDLEEAAKFVGFTLPQIQVQIAKHPALASAVYALEKRRRAQEELVKEHHKPTTVEWSDELYDRFCRAYIDTGDIAFARDAIECRASDYYEELDRNPKFKEMVDEAQPKAEQALEEKAISLALKGNDKLITLVLKAKKPEYKEKIQIDQNTTIKLSDNQLDNKIQVLLNRARVIDAEYTELGDDEPEGQRSLSGPSGGTTVSDRAQ